MKLLPAHLILSAGFFCLVPSLLFSASAATPIASAAGVITGRILNPRTGEYVRNAEVQIEGTSLFTLSGDDGTYRMNGVTPGDVVLVVSYTGYAPVRSAVSLAAGESLRCDIPLAGAATAGAGNNDPIVLAAYVVSSDRDGNAKAIMSQRHSMNITNSVASDVFGDVAEGNVGEFLKHMPGVELDTVEGDIRTIRLRGLGSEYTAVTLDGVSLASSDANMGAAGNARAFSFEQVSLNSMDSIEVSKTVSADVDANAPAGTVNLKTKRAFDREGRRISWQTNLTAHSSALTLGRTEGPDNGRSRKILPGGIFEYSDVFLNRRLGVVLNVSESNVYAVSARTTMTYNSTPTADDPRPTTPATIAETIGPRTTERFTTTLTTDFRATEHLTFGLGLIYNYNDLWFHMRTATFNAGTRTAVLGEDPLTSFTATASNASVSIAANGISKLGETMTYLPKFEYKKNDLVIEGRFVVSDSKSWYDPMGRGMVFASGTLADSGISYQAQRSSYESADWNITQVSGAPFSEGSSYSTPTITVHDGRNARAQIAGGELVGSFVLPRFPAIQWKTGIKGNRETRDYQIERESALYSYVGPGSGAGAWKNFRLPYPMDLNLLGASAVSQTGGSLFVPDIQQIAALFQEHPEYFKQTMSATNYYNANVANRKHFVEDITAAFVMGTMTMGRMQLRAGLRGEETETDSLEPDPRTAAELVAAGFEEKNGRATTIPGMEYQYFSKPKTHRRGNYGHLFPSGAFKYRFNRHLDFHLGYSRTIRRPTFQHVAGVWSVNDDALTVTAPNPNLKPELSDNLSARLAYYFEPVGLFAVSVYQNSVDGLHRSSQMTAQEYGYDGPEDLSGYTFITTVASADRTVIRGLELEYSQSLSFLPAPFSGLNARAAYTRNQADVINPNMAPHTLSAGLNYTLSRVNVFTNYNWVDDTPINTTGVNIRRHRGSVDLGGSVRLRDNLSLFVSVRNVLNAPYINLQQRASGPAVAINYGDFGSAWTFGLKGTF